MKRWKKAVLFVGAVITLGGTALDWFGRLKDLLELPGDMLSLLGAIAKVSASTTWVGWLILFVGLACLCLALFSAPLETVLQRVRAWVRDKAVVIPESIDTDWLNMSEASQLFYELASEQIRSDMQLMQGDGSLVDSCSEALVVTAKNKLIRLQGRREHGLDFDDTTPEELSNIYVKSGALAPLIHDGPVRFPEVRLTRGDVLKAVELHEAEHGHASEPTQSTYNPHAGRAGTLLADLTRRKMDLHQEVLDAHKAFKLMAKDMDTSPTAVKEQLSELRKCAERCVARMNAPTDDEFSAVNDCLTKYNDARIELLDGASYHEKEANLFHESYRKYVIICQKIHWHMQGPKSDA